MTDDTKAKPEAAFEATLETLAAELGRGPPLARAATLFERAAAAIPEVQTIEHVLGLYDYRLRVVARDLSDFERILRRRIMTLPGAGNVEANVMLSEERLAGPL